ncbi:hypothetical protein Curi_c12660 [Gottschalkia acidurici 9a]|uniref:Uncharacterized protein n=1 Tax=Gottschalkia acidurici (strain ATCC 7906 / DSM 604 / BCRC 14475 / CIP 104303 / KCTC 5404 / NCIMB 10678 / 9a) TaxID=1128398 RepID=K0AZR6_GOTA9|nr:hypothetical protein [Gottschalkia acidurici]AFS78277.1 hypothetical protein Curi_c12660 [Gottschalkia acidurici 9a]
MNKKLYYILGTVFIITSGILYSLERAISYFSWIGQMNADSSSFPSYPNLPNIFTNSFVPTFIVIGVILFVLGYRKHNKV